MMNFFRKKNTEKVSKNDAIILASGLLVFAAIAIGNMSRWSIWFDEAFSAYLLRYNFIDIARYTASDVHPPFYYWLLKLWSLVFGEGIFAIRSLSLVFIMMAIVLAYFFIRKYFGKSAALMTVLLMSVSPMLIRYSEEARMYGLVVLIATATTIVLVETTRNPTKRKWILYGVLVSLGMWTHYFMAIVWLTHWVWRLAVRGKYQSTKQFFSKDWIGTHVLAVAAFIPWLPFMIKQMGTVQLTGFWIKDVSIDSLTNMVTNTFVFLEHGDVKHWLALLVFGTGAFSLYLIIQARRRMDKEKRPLFDLLICMSVVPVLILFVASLPPLRPSYVERYLLTATFWSMMLLSVSIVYGLKDAKRKVYAFAVVPFLLCMVIGVTNVYRYGNFNRNANEASVTKDAIEMIDATNTDGQPILAESPWRFYESIYYDTPEHPVYFEAVDDTLYGSYDMLRYSDYRKIKDLASFAKAFPKIWYIGSWQDGKQHTPKGNWKTLRELTAPTPVAGSGTVHVFELQYLGA
jgi:uncharacterized membrane protein